MMIRLMLAIALALGSGGAMAQKKMYRCGNVFQERPCEGPKSEAEAAAGKAGVTSTGLPQKSQADRDRAAKEARCNNWTSDMDDVEKRIKAGVSGQASKDLENRRLELSKQLKSSCPA
jgi:hypothetical protein